MSCFFMITVLSVILSVNVFESIVKQLNFMYPFFLQPFCHTLPIHVSLVEHWQLSVLSFEHYRTVSWSSTTTRWLTLPVGHSSFTAPSSSQWWHWPLILSWTPLSVVPMLPNGTGLHSTVWLPRWPRLCRTEQLSNKRESYMIILTF